MPIIEIDGIGRVEPDPSFFQLAPEQQAKEVDALVQSYKKTQEQVAPQDTNPAEAAAAENRANLVSSAKGVASNIANTVMHPVQTAENIGTLGKGVLQKIGMISGKDAIPAADAAGEALMARYGSWDAINKTAHDDPVGFMMDLTTVGGVGGAVTGSKVLSSVSRAADPLAIAGRAAATAAAPVGKLASEAAGLTTGAGGQAVRTAFNAGAQGGEASKAFREGMAGTDGAAGVVNEAKAAVNQLRAERGAAYREGMAKVGADTEVLNFDKIDNAVNKVASVKTYKGQDLSPTTQAIRQQMTDAIEQWKALPPDQFHTAEGLDALKQKLGDIQQAAKPNTPESRIAGEIYNGVRQTIVDQAPEYAKIMKGYEEASGIIREIEKTLSLNPKASIDTALRKLQSVLRNNVNTNYGRRAELLDFLQRAGAPHLMEKLAGQALSAAAPRGLSRVIAGGEGVGALTSLALGHPGAAAGLGVGILGSSPALMGGAAYGLGASTRIPLRLLGNAAFQLGRFGGQ